MLLRQVSGNCSRLQMHALWQERRQPQPSTCCYVEICYTSSVSALLSTSIYDACCQTCALLAASPTIMAFVYLT
jgi:hypothetical protein